MIELRAYEEDCRERVVEWAADFFGFHAALVNGIATADIAAAAETVDAWRAPGHALYVIFDGEAPAGFLHIGYRGDTVAWIEDIYVIPEMRGRGVATAAIRLAEAIIAERPGYTAVCMDAVPRNEAAIRLYRRLGYDTLSIITLRKPLTEAPRDRHTQVLGLDFKY